MHRPRARETYRRWGAVHLILPSLSSLTDRWVPALLFAVAAGARGAGLPDVVGRLVATTDFGRLLVSLLELAGDLLVILFCALVATLFLARRARRGRRAGPLAMGVALAGTLLMNGIVGQPSETGDWRGLALADGLLAVGLAFSIYAAASLGPCFGVAPEARGLVTTGAYRLVRHPLYLGELVAGLGALLPVLAPSTALVYGGFCLCQAARAVLEERALAATFPEYTDYRRKTPALLPWPRSRR